jgi:ATP-dependent exoDNAse (exonuclease V) alpha subunit
MPDKDGHKRGSFNIVVLAPTGIAALNVDGQTIHSFFSLPIGYLDQNIINLEHRPMNTDIYRQLDIVVIDEVSMLRADILDAIDYRLRMYGRDKRKPFGGIRIIFVGDLFQLPPIIEEEYSKIFYSVYKTRYFLSAHVINQIELKVLPLNESFRQSEIEYLNALDAVRTGIFTDEHIDLFNSRLIENVDNTVLRITPKNNTVRHINSIRLKELSEPEFSYKAEFSGNTDDLKNKQLPAEKVLKLKAGARVVFIKNDVDKKWINGTLGTVKSVSKEWVEIQLDEDKIIYKVDTNDGTWEKFYYKWNHETRSVEREIKWVMKQIPLRLAWALTIHKSQGMTFDNLYVDLSESCFETGQLYVALSRCRTLEGLKLSNKIWHNDVKVDPLITELYNRFE